MTNPFDSNFFKFLGGFVLILGLSFAILFITQSFVNSGDINLAENDASALNSRVILNIVK
jgi:hypothetical protein